MAKLPLEGIRVVCMTPIWAGPFAESQLADWGAEIIKVECRQYCPLGTRGPGPRHPKFIVDMVKGMHSYDVPEIIALPIIGGNQDYLRWIGESVSRA